jgi:hypothetical protein
METAPDVDAMTPSTAKSKLRRLARPVAVFAISRLIVLIAVALNAGGSLLRLGMWDGFWYLSATHGYSLLGYIGHGSGLPGQSNVAFFPVLPLSIRAVEAVTDLPDVEAAIIAVHVNGLILTVLLWELVLRLTDEHVANRSLALFWFFPGTAALSMVYAESAMLAFAVACLLALLDKRWLIAGVAAAFAGVARPIGIVLLPCCLREAVVAVRSDRDWKALAAPTLAPLGLVGYFGYLWATTGNPAMRLTAERAGWQAGWDFGSQNISAVVSLFTRPSVINTSGLLEGVGFAVVVIGGAMLCQWRPPSVIVVYTIAVLFATLLARTEPVGGFGPRLILIAFPLVIATARGEAQRSQS